MFEPLLTNGFVLSYDYGHKFFDAVARAVEFADNIQKWIWALNFFFMIFFFGGGGGRGSATRVD